MYHMRKYVILIGGTVIYFAIYIILFDLNYISLLVYALLIGLSVPIIEVPYTSMTYDVIGMNRYAKEFRIEFIVIRELYVNFGRVIAIILFLLSITVFDAEQVIPYLLAIFGTGYLFIPYFMSEVQVNKEN